MDSPLHGRCPQGRYQGPLGSAGLVPITKVIDLAASLMSQGQGSGKFEVMVGARVRVKFALVSSVQRDYTGMACQHGNRWSDDQGQAWAQA